MAAGFLPDFLFRLEPYCFPTTFLVLMGLPMVAAVKPKSKWLRWNATTVDRAALKSNPRESIVFDCFGDRLNAIVS